MTKSQIPITLTLASGRSSVLKVMFGLRCWREHTLTDGKGKRNCKARKNYPFSKHLERRMQENKLDTFPVLWSFQRRKYRIIQSFLYFARTTKLKVKGDSSEITMAMAFKLVTETALKQTFLFVGVWLNLSQVY